MSSGFVSGGTTEQPRQRNELWQKAEEELEAARQRKREQKNHDGKSLFEVLQENRAAKQEAFEEAAKLKHQFRSLDEDDAAFLNSIRETENVKQQEVDKDTLARLNAFRKMQQDRETAATQASDESSEIKPAAPPAADDIAWQVTAKKRKRDQPGGIKGLKVPKVAAAEDVRSELRKRSNETSKPTMRVLPDDDNAESPQEADAAPQSKHVPDSNKHSASIAVTELLGLGDYSSDDD